jgi:hypothetical protein
MSLGLLTHSIPADSDKARFVLPSWLLSDDFEFSVDLGHGCSQNDELSYYPPNPCNSPATIASTPGSSQSNTGSTSHHSNRPCAEIAEIKLATSGPFNGIAGTPFYGDRENTKSLDPGAPRKRGRPPMKTARHSTSEEARLTRSTHNQVEKKYRDKLNGHFDRLQAVLQSVAPEHVANNSDNCSRSISKVEVLDLARRRIQELERENESLRRYQSQFVAAEKKERYNLFY